jgi:hypothetical protein
MGTEAIDPLIRECYDHFYGRGQRLGTLDAVITLAEVDEVGAIVENLAFEADGELIDQPRLVECVEQTLMSLQLPKFPVEAGRVEFTYRVVEREVPTQAGTGASMDEG